MISYDNKSLLQDGKRFFPVMGEMHYSRTDRNNWERSIRRMGAGGVDIVSSYVIWIHHEEIEGEYDFSDNKDLRAFVKTIERCNLKMFLRIGPWVHSEARNGGFPDWIYHKGFEPRTNDSAYIEQVRKFYTKIYEQVEGLFYPQGPIIGVQIENEYGHCGGLSGPDGQEHMRLLTAISKEIGFAPQLFSATGWGGAVTGGLLPVMGAYCDAPWDELIEKLPPNQNYLISHERNDKNIGSDMGLGYGLTFDTSKYPYLMAELGGGIHPTGHRRVVASSADTGAMTLCKLASGCNLLGYYMYHGGTNPVGKLTTFEESKASGSLNDMPVLNYDGRSAIRQYGQFGYVYKELKLLRNFAKQFEDILCQSQTIIFPDNAKSADDFDSLRYSARVCGKQGFLFVCNYIRGYDMPPKHIENIDINGEKIKIDMSVDSRQYGAYPINFPLPDGRVIKSGNVTPLFCLNNSHYFFHKWQGQKPTINIEESAQSAKGNKCEIVVIDRNQALNASKITFDKDYAFVTDGFVLQTERGVTVTAPNRVTVGCFPPLSKIPRGWTVGDVDCCGFTNYYAEKKHKEASCKIVNTQWDNGKTCYDIEIDYGDTPAEEIIVDILYQGDKGQIYIDGKLANDDFNCGDCWQLELNSLGRPQRMRLEITPLCQNAPIYCQNQPKYIDGVACRLENIQIKCLYGYCMEVL